MAKVLESGDPKFKEGDFVWGMTGWEEYSLITATQALFKIHDTDVQLSYYTGILGIFLVLFSPNFEVDVFGKLLLRHIASYLKFIISYVCID